MRSRLVLLFPLFLGACAEPAGGFVWEVTLTDAEDTCNDPPVPYEDTLRYTLAFDGGDTTLALGHEVFAAGALSGCFVDYRSVVWAEEHEGAEIRWQLEGSAQFRQGGASCNLDAGVDWLGTETFTIVASEHPDLAVGCTYTLDARGVYVGEG